jgi:hypothetical protein
VHLTLRYSDVTKFRTVIPLSLSNTNSCKCDGFEYVLHAYYIYLYAYFLLYLILDFFTETVA